MEPRASKNSGFSLIELMIALVIIMISMLALLASILVSINTNMENDLRNTAVRLANQTAEVLLALPLNDAELTVGSPPHQRTTADATQNAKGFPDPMQSIRSGQREYTIEWSVEAPTASVKEVTVTVTYMYKERSLSYSTVIYKHAAI